MGAGRKLFTTTTESYFDFSNKGGRLKQILYGNSFSVLDSFWVSISKFLFFLVGLMGLLPNLARVRPDKYSSLIISGEENPGYIKQDLDGSGFDIKEGFFNDNGDHVKVPGSSLVSISRRYEVLSDNSIRGFVEEPKVLSFVVHDHYLDSDEREELPVREKSEEGSIESDDSTESFFALEKKLKEEMLVYEFKGCDDVKEEIIHQNFIEESLSDDDDFIELRPEVDEFSMNFEEHQVYNFDDDDSDDDDDDDDEHNDVIERLKNEIRSARTGGLATILEESETPLEEPKPLKIDSKFEFKERIAEIHKVYKSYTVKMRKLDVLDSQTMHSISLIKLKDSIEPCTRKEDSSLRSPKSQLRQNLWPFKKQQIEHHPVERLVKDVGRDFETVYVGHLCLSWEILHWQYIKVLEFQQHDPTRTCQYNLVAGEFQLFQVLIQRFVENEPFQSCSRIENYLKNRRCFHNFLQIPFVRDDRSTKTKKCKNEGSFAITIQILREIIEESMNVFWEFIRADKHEFSSILKVSHHTQVSPQDPLDLELLTDIRTNLQKKEKKLKEIMRSETCIVRQMKKKKKKERKRVEVVIAQVELRLVSRVMNMSKLTTDQLVWCKEKLNKIIFNGRRIHLDPSFSFFPF